MIRLLAIVFLQIVLICSFSFSQRMLLDNSIENKNQLFELFGVKSQIAQCKNIQMNDSILSGYSFQTLLIDSSGYVTKKEGFNSWSNPPKSVIEFERDKNGNIIQIFSDTKLVESKSYNDSNKFIQWSFYKADTLSDKWYFNYDSFGNQIALLYEYPPGKIDTEAVVLFEYDYQHSIPKLLKETKVSDGDTDIYIYDEKNRIKKVVNKSYLYNSEDSTLYFYSGSNLKDSLIIFYNGKIDKLVREYDECLRCDRMISYNASDSILEDLIFEYDNNGIEIRDSIFIANDIEMLQKPYDEMMGEQIVSRMIVNGKVSFTTTTSYYPNGLLKQMIKTDFSRKLIEETNYEYEFY